MMKAKKSINNKFAYENRSFLQFSFTFLFLLTFSNTIAFSQCGCMSSLSISSLSPSIGQTNSGTMKENFLNVNLITAYFYGDKYYSSTNEIPSGIVKDFQNFSTVLYASYGITNRLSIDADIGFVIKNKINAPPFSYERVGFSNLDLMGKYNLYYNPRNDFEITLGLGGLVPIQMVSDTNYQFTQTSQGAYAGAYQIFLHKGFHTQGFHVFLINKGQFYLENSAKYQYGPYFVTSCIGTYAILENLLGVIEIKNENKAKDKSVGVENYDSGYNSISVAPQLMYLTPDFNLSLKYELPVYRNYYGEQAVRNYTIYLTLGKTFDFTY